MEHFTDTLIREHYRKDLEPFSCISEDCAETVPTFSSLKSWREHMLRHHSSWIQYIHRQPMWKCNLESMHESEALFSTPDHLRGHVRALHERIWNSLDDASFAALAEESVFDVLRKPNTCPLCCLTPKGMESLDYPPEEIIPVPRAMENHIAEHLQNLMVLSLRLIETQNEEPDGDSKGGSMTPNESNQGSLVDHSEADSDSDGLPSPPFGSPTVRPESLALNDGEPPETDAQDWSDVAEKTQRQHPELDCDTDSILDHLRTQQESASESPPTKKQVEQSSMESARSTPSLEDDSHLLELLPYAPQAAFNSFDKQHDPLCLPGTRVDVLNQIRAWADGRDEGCIFWLNGMAGTGKSTIARTIAREYYNRKRLGASFFFSRGMENQSHAGMFFTTIAVQLARILPTLKQYICTAVSEHKDIAGRRQRDQWEHLILQPLSKLTADSCQSPLILVIDALNECDGDNDVKGILQLFAEAKSLEPIQLRIFITSRPETPIRLGFRDMPGILHRDLVLNDVSREIIDNDISIYFRHELSDIDLSPQIITRLTEKACGLFVWAATACRFIKSGKRVARQRLSLILEDGKSGRNPEKELDQVYAKILFDSIRADYDEDEMKEVFELFREVIGAIVILFNPLSAAALSELLNKPRLDVSQILSDFHSVLEVPENNVYPIRLLHPSFRDFLLTKERCQYPQFWVDEKQMHLDLAKNCLLLISNGLKRDICDLHNPSTFITDVGSDRVEQFLPPEFQYACIYWVQHLQKSRAQLRDDDQVHQFLQKHLLHWLEALSLTGKTSEGVLAIISLESVIPVSHIAVY